MRALATRTGPVVALGVLLWCGSESVFWSRPPSGAGSLLGGIAAYAVIGVLASALRPRTLPAVTAAGAVYGWLVEGVGAVTLYGTAEIPFPVTLAWTALAWHLPVVVLGIWWLLGRALHRGAAATAAFTVPAGAAWGVWGAGWGAATPVLEFAAVALGTTVLVAAAHVVLGGRLPRPGRGLTIACAVLATVRFAVVVVPAVPWAPLVLLPLLGLVVLLERRGSGGPLPSALPVRPRAVPVLVAVLPLAAVAARAACGELSPAAVQFAAAGLLTVGGVAVFVVAATAVCHRRTPSAVPRSADPRPRAAPGIRASASGRGSADRGAGDVKSARR